MKIFHLLHFYSRYLTENVFTYPHMFSVCRWKMNQEIICWGIEWVLWVVYLSSCVTIFVLKWWIIVNITVQNTILFNFKNFTQEPFKVCLGLHRAEMDVLALEAYQFNDPPNDSRRKVSVYCVHPISNFLGTYCTRNDSAVEGYGTFGQDHL